MTANWPNSRTAVMQSPTNMAVETTGMIESTRASGVRANGRAARNTARTTSERATAACSLVSGCLILDYKMPGVSGLELQETLASRGAQWQIVFLSGKVDIAKSVKAMKNGAIDVLVKPTTNEVLIAAVERAIERNRVA